MADSMILVEKVKAFWRSQIQDERNWDVNKSLLRAAGMFVGAIILMREYGDLMAV